MDLEIGKQVTLGGEVYQIKKLLGSGALADAYLATPAGAPNLEVVIKILRNGLNINTAETQKVLDGLRNEIKVLQTLNNAEDPEWMAYTRVKPRLERALETTGQRRVVALLDSGEIDGQQIFQVQEKAPPAISLADFEIKSVDDERRLLEVMSAVLEVLSLAHKNDFSLRDFEPNTKWDRLRLKWLDNEHKNFELKVIDWNVTGEGEGFSQDLLYFGGHLFRLLFKHDITFEGKEHNVPPRNLATLVHGWDGVTEGTHQILQKLLQRDADRRYRWVDSLQVDFKWWLEILNDARSADAFYVLQDRLWDLKRDENFSRVLSVADLALRALPTAEAKNAFQPWIEQAQQELEKQDILPIAHARGTLLIGAFEKAALEFEKELFNLPPESEAARQAGIYIALARAGEQMKKAKGGADVRETAAWLALERGAREVIKQNSSEASLSFLEASRAMPQMKAWAEFNTLKDKVIALELCEEAKKISETPKIEFEKKLKLLREAREIDPKNEEIKSFYEDVQVRWQKKQQTDNEIKQIESDIETASNFLAEANNQIPLDEISKSGSIFILNDFLLYVSKAQVAFQNVLNACEEILNNDPTHKRADELKLDAARGLNKTRECNEKAHERIDKLTTDAENLASKLAAIEGIKHEARQLANTGCYINAREKFLSFLKQHGVIPPELEDLWQEINFAANIESGLRDNEDNIKENKRLSELNITEIAKSESLFGNIIEYNDCLFSGLPNGEKLTDSVAKRSFRLASDIREFADKARKKLGKLKDIVSTPAEDDRAILNALLESRGLLESLGNTLSEPLLKRIVILQDQIEKHDRQVEKYNRFKQELGKTAGFDALEKIANEIKADDSVAAREIKDKIAVQWRVLIGGLNDLDDVKIRLQRGFEIFPEQTDFKDDKEKAERLSKIRTALKQVEGNLYSILFEDNDQLKRDSKFLSDLKGSEFAPLKKNAEDLWEEIKIQYEKVVKDKFADFTEIANFLGGREDIIRADYHIWNDALLLDALPDVLQEKIKQFTTNQIAYENIKQNLKTHGSSFVGKLNELETLQRNPKDFFEAYADVLVYRLGSKDLKLDVTDIQPRLKQWHESAVQAVKTSLSNMQDEQGLNRAIALLDNFLAIIEGMKREEKKYQASFSDNLQSQAWRDLAPKLQELSELRQKQVDPSKVLADLQAMQSALAPAIELVGKEENKGNLAEYSRLLNEALLPMTKLLLGVDVFIGDNEFLKALLELELDGRKYHDDLKQSVSSRWLMGNYQDVLKKSFQAAQDVCSEKLQAQAERYLTTDVNTAPEELKKNMLIPCANNSRARIIIRAAIEKAGEATTTGRNRKSKRCIWNAIVKSSEGLGIQEWDVLHQTALEQVKSLVGLDPKWRRGFALAGGIILVVVVLTMYNSYRTGLSANATATEGYQQTVQANMLQTEIVIAQTKVAMTKNTMDAPTQQFIATQTQSAQQSDLMTEVAKQLCRNEKNYAIEVITDFPMLSPQPGSRITNNDPIVPEVSASWKVRNNGQCDWPVAKLQLGLSPSSVTYKEIRFLIESKEPDVVDVVRVNSMGDVFLNDDLLETNKAESIKIPVDAAVTLTIVLDVTAAADYYGNFPAYGIWSLSLVDMDLQDVDQKDIIGDILVGKLNLVISENRDVWIKLDNTIRVNALVPAPSNTPTSTPTSTLTPTPTLQRLDTP